MDKHATPPDAETLIRQAAYDFLLAVQTAVGTEHRPSIVKLAVFGLTRIAKDFGVSPFEMIALLRDVEAHVVFEREPS